jgi:predicted negative regulator of RcsB-dependent stress response
MAGSYDFEEQERLAELKAWWEDNRMYVFGAIAAAVIGFGGWQGWRFWEQRQDEEAAALFLPVGEAQRTNDPKKVSAAAGKVVAEQPGSFYASQAALIAAKAAFDAGNLDEARKHLEWVMNKGVSPHRGVARVRLAAVLLEQKKFDEALATLDGSKEPGFVPLAADMRGDVMLAQGRLDEARAAYRQAIEKADARNPVKGIAQTKLNALGGTQ